MEYYVYILCDPRKLGKYRYGRYVFEYEPFYVGKGCGDRKCDTLKTGNSNKLKRIHLIRRNKLEPVVVIRRQHAHLTETEAHNKERELIARIGKAVDGGPLANLTSGGQGTTGLTMSEETKSKISVANRSKLSGSKNPMYGKHHTKKTRRKMSENRPDYSGSNNPMYGRAPSKETRCKISEAHQGKTLAASTRKKISKAVSGENNPFYGRTHSEESRQKISEATQNRVHPTFHWFIITPEGDALETDHLRAFCEKRGLNYAVMTSIEPRVILTYKGGWICARTEKAAAKLRKLSLKEFKYRATHKRVFSEEHKANMSKVRRETWRAIDPSGKKYLTDNLTEFCEHHGLRLCCMIAVANGVQKSHRGGWRCEHV